MKEKKYIRVVLTESRVLQFLSGTQADAGQALVRMKQDHKSKNPTTRWSDIIKLK